ncbi:AEC family transporter [Ornithinibacillus salinisoli]|uniref:AEC family transporter n=1 Tax=Ornithinibacillus salinisoli TaxID=1848459 RepID=A0ABW4VZZ8_9BACI
MGLFFNVILPIVAVFGAGYILQRIRILDVKSIASMSIHIFLPALVFTQLYEAEFDQSYTIILGFSFFLLIMMIVLNKILRRILKWERSVESASILTSAFMNAGNYGVPVILFSIGQEALPYAVFFMVIQTIFMNAFGVYYASRDKSGYKRAVKTILRLPATYAAVFAFILQNIAWEIPEPVFSTLSMLSGAAIPIMMVMLGMQLASITSIKFNWQVIISALTIRMIVAPLLTFAFILVLDVDPIIGTVLFILASMPSAATTTMYAIEFDTEPDLVSSITLVTTLFSIVSITVLLNLIT